jgi:hypothetical protein
MSDKDNRQVPDSRKGASRLAGRREREGESQNKRRRRRRRRRRWRMEAMVGMAGCYGHLLAC